MKIIGKVTIKKDGVVIKPLGPAEWTIGVDLAREVPYDSVSQAERRRMESDARLRAEARLREWRRS